jgi:Peptidase family M50.
MEEMRDYKPIQPRGGGPNMRKILERVGGLAVLIGTTALKWGFIFVKFFGFFISVAAYTLWFHSWTFALGFVLMILVHELGHAAEARRQGLDVSGADVHPVHRRVREDPARGTDAVAKRAHLTGRARGGRRRGGGRLGGRRAAQLDDAHRAREQSRSSSTSSTSSRSASSTAARSPAR